MGNKRKLKSNQALAKLSLLKVSPQKLNIVADAIRGKHIKDARNILNFSVKKCAFDVKKLLNSAIANAENNHQLNIDNLFVKEVLVGKAITLKRFMPCARGRAGRIAKPFSNLTIILQQEGINGSES